MEKHSDPRVPVILKGTHEIVGYYAGAIPARAVVFRWSDPEAPDVGVEAAALYEVAPDDIAPIDHPVKAIMVASLQSLAGLPSFERVA